MTVRFSPRHIGPVNSLQLVAWMCLCSRCGARGYVEVQEPHHPSDPFLRQCEVCNGVKREPIPWSEIFRAGREWVEDPMDWYEEDEEDWYDDED